MFPSSSLGHVSGEGPEDPSDMVSRNSSPVRPSTHIASGRRPVSSSGPIPFPPFPAPPRTLPAIFYTPPSLPPLPLQRILERGARGRFSLRAGPDRYDLHPEQPLDQAQETSRRVSLPAPLVDLDPGDPVSVPLARTSGFPIETTLAMQAQESTSRLDDRAATNFSPAARSPLSASPLSSPGPSEDEDDEKEMAPDEQEIEADDEGVSGEQKASARGPNTSVNYKIKFQKARERYNRIQADSASLLKGLQDAQKKEKKLEEEINWLLDTLASRRPDLARLEQ